MAVDTPARIVVIGAGPIGLESALYARYLGYDVDVLDQGEVGSHVQRWAHVQMFSTWRQLVSPLGCAAIRAHEPDWELPSPDDRPTGREWLDRYLIPLSQTDLLLDHIQTSSRVVAVSRSEWLKTDRQVDRRDWTLRVLVCHEGGGEVSIDADAVIDASGILSQPNAFGPGGAPAIGERSATGQIWRIIPDLAAQRDRFAGKSTLVIGGGTSAATTVWGLVRLADEVPETRVTWLRRRAVNRAGGFQVVDGSESRRAILELMQRAQDLESTAPSCLQVLTETWVESITYHGGRWRVVTGGEHPTEWEGDCVVALVGYRPDVTLFRELQVELTSDTEAPRGIADWREFPTESGTGGDENGAWLSTGEPDFYIVGAKSFGRAHGYFHADGLREIRSLFARLADRVDLDLYATVPAPWGDESQ